MTPRSRDAREYHKNTGLAEFRCKSCGRRWDDEIRGFYNDWENETMVPLVQAGHLSQKEATKAKKKYRPSRLEGIFHRKGYIEVEFCRPCREKFKGYLDKKSALGTDGRMNGEGKA